MPLEFLVFATFFLVQLWFQWERTRNNDGLASVESQQENGLQRAGMGRVKTQWNLMEFGWYSETDSPHSKPTSPEDPGSNFITMCDCASVCCLLADPYFLGFEPRHIDF